jgi:hypothetical protein
MTRRLDNGEWIANGSEEALCLLPLRLAEVGQLLGWGAVPAVQHAVLQLDGDVLRLQEQASSGRVQVWVRGDVQAPGRCLLPLCAVLGLRQEALPWVAEELGPKPWLLIRLDDNGNRAPMWYFRERGRAEAVAKGYAARGHRQSYEVERVV